MKKVYRLLLGLATIAVASPNVMAEDVYVKIDHNNPDISIVQGSGKFDKVNLLLGNVTDDLVVDLGEFDFDNNSFKAAYFDYANGWGGGCNLLLSVGQNFASATPLVKIPAIPSNSYYLARRFAQNFGFEVDNYIAPTGRQHVYASSADGNGIGNLVGIGLVEKEYTAADYYRSDNYKEVSYNTQTRDEDLNKRLLWPSEDKRWDDKHIEIPASGFFNVDDPDQTKEAGQIDVNDGSIGWTGNNLKMQTRDNVDFGSNRFNQLVVWTKLSDYQRSVDINMFLDFYIDEVKEENRIGHIWYGMEAWGNGSPYLPLVCNLEKSVSGSHAVIMKWGNQGSNNVMNIGFYEGNGWSPTPVPDASIYPIEAQPNEDAFAFNFVQEAGNTRSDVADDASSKIYNNDWKCQILNRGEWESDNIGWNGDGSIYVITDVNGNAYDFGNHNYSGVIVKYGSGGDSYGITSEDANIRLYVDLDAYGPLEWGNPDQYYDSGSDIAEIRMAKSGDWNNLFSYYSEIKDPTKLQGKHKLFIALRNKDRDNAGANIKGIYFIERKGVDGEIVDIKDGFTVTYDENITLTNADGIIVANSNNVNVASLTPSVSVDKNVLTVTLETYPAGDYKVTIPENLLNVGLNYSNNAIEDHTVATWDTIKTITIAHTQNGELELSAGEETELVVTVETQNGKEFNPATELTVSCENNSANHVVATDIKDNKFSVSVAEAATKSETPVAIKVTAGDVASNAVNLTHYAAPGNVELGETGDEFLDNTITVEPDADPLNYTVKLVEGSFPKYVLTAADNDFATIAQTDNGITITPKAIGETQFSITPLKAGEYKNEQEPTAEASIFKVVVSETSGVQIFNNNGEEVEIFNLQGVKVAHPQRGIFIINGKKVVVK